MALKAFGAYIAHLRTRAGYTQQSLVAALDNNPSLRTIGRWENGRQEPYLSELEPVIEKIKGSMPRAALLIMSEKASVADAMRMAERADEDLTEEELLFYSSLSSKQRRALRALMQQELDDLG